MLEEKADVTLTEPRIRKLLGVSAKVELKQNGKVWRVVVSIPFHYDEEGKYAEDLFKDLTI